VRAFRALCTNPSTGQPADPREVFRQLDADGSGSVDVGEFRDGLGWCHCDLSDDELHDLW
jgi:Ca2+-binding EF-hand superfamily protein